MPRPRKTKDEWQLWSNYGYGWERELSEDTWRDMRKQLKCYRENCPQYQFMARKNGDISQELADMLGFPGTVVYHITGLSAELVQREVDRLFNQVEQIGGCAEFDIPKRKGNGYYSQGYIFLQPYRKTHENRN